MSEAAAALANTHDAGPIAAHYFNFMSLKCKKTTLELRNGCLFTRRKYYLYLASQPAASEARYSTNHGGNCRNLVPIDDSDVDSLVELLQTMAEQIADKSGARVLVLGPLPRFFPARCCLDHNPVRGSVNMFIRDKAQGL